MTNADDDLTPDIPAEELTSYATLPQQYTVEQMLTMGWAVSHLWRKDEGEIVVWMIARMGKGYSQGYVDPAGKLVRYVDKVKIRRDRDDE